MKSAKRKGFTLVELLIVIVVIGILSAMMMLSSSEAVTSAKAATIVAGMRNVKTAVLAYLADNVDNPELPKKGEELETEKWLPYLEANALEKTGTKEQIAGYKVIAGKASDNDGLYVDFCITADSGNTAGVSPSEAAAIKEKLKSRAKSVGLLKDRTVNSAAYDGGNYVHMRVQ